MGCTNVPPVQILAGLTLALGATVIGYSGAYTSPALPDMKKDGKLQVTEEQASWIGSLMSLFAMFGGIIGGSLIEHLGRKKTLIGTAIPTALSYLLIGFAQNVYMIYAGRVLKGLCVGILSLTTPVFLGEVIEPRIRGTMGVLPATFGNSAMLICFVAGIYTSWNYLAFIGACLPIPLFILMLMFIPETPRWYLSKGRHKDAVDALTKLRSKDADIEREVAEIEHNIEEANKNVAGLKDLLQRSYIKALGVSLGLMLFQQMSGINAVIAYTVDIFAFAGSTIQENIATCIVGVVNMLATIASNVLIDKLGRKILLLISGTFMAVTLITLGVYFQLQNDYGQGYTSSFGWLPLLCLVLYIISFSLGFGPIPWLMLGEIFPNKIRGPAASTATAFNWAMSFIVTKTFFNLKEGLGKNGVFYLYGVICIFAVIFTATIVPETKGRSLEDIEKQLAKTASFIRREKQQRRAEMAAS